MTLEDVLNNQDVETITVNQVRLMLEERLQLPTGHLETMRRKTNIQKFTRKSMKEAQENSAKEQSES